MPAQRGELAPQHGAGRRLRKPRAGGHVPDALQQCVCGQRVHLDACQAVCQACLIHAKDSAKVVAKGLPSMQQGTLVMRWGTPQIVRRPRLGRHWAQGRGSPPARAWPGHCIMTIAATDHHTTWAAHAVLNIAIHVPASLYTCCHVPLPSRALQALEGMHTTRWPGEKAPALRPQLSTMPRPSAPGVSGSGGRPIRPWISDMSAGLTGRRVTRTRTSPTPGCLASYSST